MPVLTPDAVRSVGASLPQVRRAAIERATATPFPSPEIEVWRYSRIDELSLDRFTPAASSIKVTGAPSGVTVNVVSPADAATDPAVAALFDGVEGADLFDDLNLAHMHVVVVRIARGTVADTPIVITHDCTGVDKAFFPRLVIDAAENSEITVVERFVSDESAVTLTVPVLDARVAQAARVRYLAINELGESSWLIGRQHSVGQRDSDTLLASVSLGGDYARVVTDARVEGVGANTRQVALYFAGGEQMHDFRTLQDHVAPRTTSDLLFKGAVQDSAKSVYTGLIRIGHEAKGSAAYQTNRNLTLSHGAWAESVPNLDIQTNDVKCSHASTVGPIDEDQLFYLESRGVHPDVAQRLVVLGFFDEVLAQLPVGDLAATLRERVANKLNVGSSNAEVSK